MGATPRPTGSTADRITVATTHDRRLEVLDDHLREHRVVFVTGPPGYGKTHLVRRWRLDRSPAKQQLVSATAAADPRSITGGLLQAAADLVPSGEMPSPPTTTANDRLGDEHRKRLHESFIAAPPATVVLDVTGTHQPLPIMVDITTLLLDADLRHITLLVTSRARPPADLAPLVIRGLVGHIDESVLEMRPDETRTMIHEVAGRAPPDDLVQLTTELVEGWPLGVELVARTLMDPTLTIGSVQELLSDYLTVEVASALTGDQRAVVNLASLFERFPPELLAEIGGHGNISAQVLSELRAASCLLRPGPDGRQLRVHPMLRQAVSKGPGQLEPSERNRLLREAAEWFLDRGHSLDAGRCYRDLADWETGGQVLVSHLSEILANERLEDLLDVTQNLPIPFQVSHLRWSLGIAWLEIFTGRVPQGLDRLAALERHCDDAELKALLVLRAASAPFRHDPEPALIAAERALALLAASDPNEIYEDVFVVFRTTHFEALVRGNALVAGCYLGAWDRVVHHDVDIDPVTLAELTPTALYGIFGRRAAFHALAGSHLVAEDLVRRARLLLDLHGDLVVTAPDLLELAEVQATMGQGRHEEASALLDAISPLPNPGRPPNAHAWFASQGAQLAIHAGAAGKALEILDRALARLSVPPAPFLQSMLLSARARAKLDLNDPVGAEKVLRDAPPSFLTRWTATLALLDQANLRDSIAHLADWPREHVPAGQVRRSLAAAAIADMRGTPADADMEFALAARVMSRHHEVQPLAELGVHGTTLLARADRGEPAIAQLEGILTPPEPNAAAELLTPGEAKVMAHLAQNITLREVADRLHLSINTVKSHARRIYRKLEVDGRAQAVTVWSDRRNQ